MSLSSRLHSVLRQFSKAVPQLELYQANVRSTTQCKKGIFGCSGTIRHSSHRNGAFIQGDISQKSCFGQNKLWYKNETCPVSLQNLIIRFYATDSSDKSQTQPSNVPETTQVKETLWKRFKTMYKEYWYVLLPVHTATSIVWYGSFYYMAKSGIDIVPMLEKLGTSEIILKPLRGTDVGYFAIAYAMYKIATPARYTVTLGGTTVTINYLKKWGYIKPMPSSEAMKEMIREKGKQLRTHRAKVLAKMNLRRRPSPKAKPPNQTPEKP